GTLRARADENRIEAASTEVSEPLEKRAEQGRLLPETPLPPVGKDARRGAGEPPAGADQVLIEYRLDHG
ncbi:MAG: hypothetical protein GWO02_10875, partial [Gammaproteobacteria bacterium]|nr:hypothetical protein [Gammaproteobacteria bacterium]